ncbi:hypothetical protein J4573_40020 [Actinomadura barringtoniae]|uniref:Uncharacterized protein n=1 Tax=Actinomadura barringtoniae TaxID=1427535 RepID=A0A939T7P8_9ACTN|nr:hypothetical protein [Actinomadura barringtoniae]MBO2453338.1 hypothetical protein [Actinomadura barringtoniae]
MRDVPSEWELDCDDLLRFWGAAPVGAGVLAVRLVRSGERSERGITFEVLPARGDPRWWSDEAGEVMPKLVTAPPE